jgi:hypothetical protein
MITALSGVVTAIVTSLLDFAVFSFCLDKFSDLME